jgi:hypothetical protein
MIFESKTETIVSASSCIPIRVQGQGNEKANRKYNCFMTHFVVSWDLNGPRRSKKSKQWDTQGIVVIIIKILGKKSFVP